MNRVRYYQIVKDNKPKTKRFIKCLLAFLCGGTIGLLNQFLIDLYINVFQCEQENAFLLSGLTLVLIATILTVTNIYSKLAQIFGAGIFVPITGFSNSMVSSALEGKTEGFVPGIGCKIFTLAGSVISYGVFASVFIVLIRYLLSFFGVNL